MLCLTRTPNLSDGTITKLPMKDSSKRPRNWRLLVDAGSFIPYYEQIVNQVRSLIKDQELSEGEIFCSEGELARSLGISKMPVRQAFQKLRSEGLLILARGKKPLIGSGKVPWNFQQLRGFSEEMTRRGLTPSAKLLSLELIDPDADVRQALKTGHGERVYFLRRLRLVGGEPVAIVTSYLPAAIFPDFEKQDLEGQSLYHIFEHCYKRKLQWAEEVIGAATVTSENAELLHTVPGSAVLLIKETTYDTQQSPIEFSISLLRGDRYTASVVSLRRR